MALLFGEDRADILRNKQIVQNIYNANFDFGVVTDIKDEAHAVLPVEYSLSQNYPNPFNPTTAINYALPQSGNVSLVVYNIRGEEVAFLINGTVPAGVHSVNWDASTVSSGIYFYRLTVGDLTETKKMLLLK